MMSIEVTRECPLHCPGCYAYGENHLGGEVNLRSLSDYGGDELVERMRRSGSPIPGRYIYRLWAASRSCAIAN